MNKKKLIVGALSVALVTPSLYVAQPAFAQDMNNLENGSYEMNLYEDLSQDTISYIDSLSVPELNEYIDNIANSTSFQESNSRTNMMQNSVQAYGMVDSKVAVKAAWYAAAKVAELKGYTCAGKLVEYSVLGRNYYEQGGMFSSKIKQASEYSAWANNSNSSSIAFNSGDLFYALHNVNIRYSAMSSQGAMVHVHDKFDFAFDMTYDSFFTSAVNNWAWLCQNSDVLNPIDVDIYFVY